MEHLGTVADDDQGAHLRLQDAVDPLAQGRSRRNEPQGSVERFRSGRRQPLLQKSNGEAQFVRTSEATLRQHALVAGRSSVLNRRPEARGCERVAHVVDADELEPVRHPGSTAARSRAETRAAALRRAAAPPAALDEPHRRARSRRARPFPVRPDRLVALGDGEQHREVGTGLDHSHATGDARVDVRADRRRCGPAAGAPRTASRGGCRRSPARRVAASARACRPRAPAPRRTSAVRPRAPARQPIRSFPTGDRRGTARWRRPPVADRRRSSP